MPSGEGDAVVGAGESETGITLHEVNNHYDEGAIFFQISVPIDALDTAETVEFKVRALEKKYFVDQVAAWIALTRRDSGSKE